MSYPRYPAYKASGVEWLGEIPAHWEVATVRRYFDVELGKMLNQAKQDGSGTRKPYLRAANIHWDRLVLSDINEMEFSDQQLERYKLQKGDLLVTEGGVTVGRSAIWNGELEECYYQNSLNRARQLPDSPLSTRFLLYWMQFTTMNGYVDLVAEKATFGHLTNEKLKAFPVVVPSESSEQQAIAAFLDRKTAEIDALIAEKRRLLALLQEQRAALITQAVTQGLDPSAPRKDSGVPWLGEIPAHWEVKRLKQVVTFQRGHDLPAEERSENGNIPIISSSGAFGFHSAAMAKAPGIVTGRYGTIGTFYLVEEDYWPLNTTLYTISLHNNDAKFLYFMLNHLSSLFLMYSAKSAVPGIDRNDIHEIQTAVPPREEQIAIVDYIESKTQRLNELAVEIANGIAYLQEYRTALISAAVTGQIDVRGA